MFLSISGVLLTIGEAAAQTCVAPPSGIVSWWRGDGSAADTIDGNSGTLQGGTFFAASQVGQGFNFDSNDDRVVIAHNANLNIAAPGFTAEFWMKGIHNQPQSLYAVFDKSHGFTDFTGWAFQGDSTSGHLGFVAGNGSSFPGISTLTDVLDGSFHHIAGTWDGSTIRIYLDGLLKDSTSLTTSAGNTRALNIGFAFGGGNPQRFFRGTADELAIYNRALSQTEIQSIVNAGTAGKCRPCGDGFLNNDEQCDDGNTVSGDCCSATCTAESEGTPCASDGVACTLDQCDGTGVCTHPSDGSCPCLPRPAGVISWWPGENNATDVIDGNPGTLQNGMGFAAAKVATGFNNTNVGSVNIPHNTNLNMSAPGFTAELWIKGTHTQSEALWDAMDKGHHVGGWALQGQTASGRLCAEPGGVCSVGVDVLDSDFHHVATTWDGTVSRMYVDGVQRSVVNVGLPAGNTVQLNFAQWTAGGRAFRGSLDEVTVYNRPLTATEVQRIFSAGSAGKCLSPCGNGAVEPGEQCDDGNTDNTDACLNTCMNASCGDGFTYTGVEQCDDANASNNDACLNNCTTATCGDGFTYAGFEQCDDANASNSDACLNDCTNASCGDGFTYTGVEQCDDANASNTDACLNDCTNASCGDGFTYTGVEQCDDANASNNDACLNNCTTATCGDGFIHSGVEDCDDSNTSNGDCCSSTCAFEASGSACTPDSNVCTDDECDGTGSCVHANNTEPCDDGVFCNGADVCAAGTCTHAGDPCETGPECADTCNEGGEHCNEPAGTACTDDGSVCTMDECNGSGACAHAAGNTGAPCRAAAGECDVSESCNGVDADCPADGFTPDGTSCDDEEECTIEDQCTTGACAGSSMTCGDGTVQAGCNEQCDDGNFALDDGCDDACQLEPCAAEPDNTCKLPFVGAKASLKLKHDLSDTTKNSVLWKWSNGSETDKDEFGDPLTADDYWLCIYDDNELVSTTRVPFGGVCGTQPCWSEKNTGYKFKNKAALPEGATGVSLAAGDDGKAKAQLKGKGANLDLPDLGPVTGPVVVQLRNATSGACWSATYSAPFTKHDEVSLSDRAD